MLKEIGEGNNNENFFCEIHHQNWFLATIFHFPSLKKNEKTILMSTTKTASVYLNSSNSNNVDSF